MGKDDKYIKFSAKLVVVSEPKELVTKKGTEFTNFLARPSVGPAVRLNFYGYNLSELERITGFRLKNGAKVDVIGFLTSIYDEKPDITVHYFKVQGQTFWHDMTM
jgi:hypothetical protein